MEYRHSRFPLQAWHRLLGRHPARLALLAVFLLLAALFIGGGAFTVGASAGRFLPAARDTILAGGFTTLSALMLVVGSLWGRPTWGTWWEWDARLTSTAILFFLYLGYLALRRTGATAEERGNRCAIAGIAFLGIGLIGILVLLSHVLFGSAAAAVVGTVTAAVVAGLWFVVPLRRRARSA